MINRNPITSLQNHDDINNLMSTHLGRWSFYVSLIEISIHLSDQVNDYFYIRELNRITLTCQLLWSPDVVSNGKYILSLGRQRCIVVNSKRKLTY